MDSVFLNFLNTLELAIPTRVFSSAVLDLCFYDTMSVIPINISVTIPWASFFPFDMLSLFTL